MKSSSYFTQKTFIKALWFMLSLVAWFYCKNFLFVCSQQQGSLCNQITRSIRMKMILVLQHHRILICKFPFSFFFSFCFYLYLHLFKFLTLQSTAATARTILSKHTSASAPVFRCSTRAERRKEVKNLLTKDVKSFRICYQNANFYYVFHFVLIYISFIPNQRRNSKHQRLRKFKVRKEPRYIPPICISYHLLS